MMNTGQIYMGKVINLCFNKTQWYFKCTWSVYYIVSLGQWRRGMTGRNAFMWSMNAVGICMPGISSLSLALDYITPLSL